MLIISVYSERSSVGEKWCRLTGKSQIFVTMCVVCVALFTTSLQLCEFFAARLMSSM